MTQINHESRLCLFCYKCVSDDNQQKNPCLDKFSVLLKRFIGDSNNTTQISLLPSLHDCCRDCEYLVDEFCNIYHRIKCSELQLFLKMRTLEQVMKMADRVPSRVKLIKQCFEKSTEEENLTSENQNKLAIFTKFRMEIFKNCQKGQALSMLSPRVTLKRYSEGMYSVGISPCSATATFDDAEAEIMDNLSGSDEKYERISDKSIHTTCIQNELFTSIDFPKNSESSVGEAPTKAVKNEVVTRSENVIQSTNAPLEISLAPDSNQNTNGKSTLKKFPCLHCLKTFAQEEHLKNHVWSRHRTANRSNFRKSQTLSANRAKYRCPLCNIFCMAYQGLKSHKYSAMHQLLFRRNLKTRLIKRDQDSEYLKTQHQDRTKESQEIKTEDQNISQNVISKNKSKHCSSDSDSTDTEDNYLDSCSSSSHDEDEKLNGISPSKYFYCRRDGCKSKVKIFKSKIVLEEHKKLHKRGHYACKFCNKIESTAIKLCFHECEMHSAIPSTSLNTKTDEGIFNCARCPFESKIEAAYVKHFASVHLGIYNIKSGKSLSECEICKKKLLDRKHIIATHFKTHHNTNGLEDPKIQIKKCDEVGCTAYFLSTDQLRIHKEMQHSSVQPSQDFVTEELNDEDDLEIKVDLKEGPLKCSFCEKVFSSVTYLWRHQRKFHSRKTSKNELSEKERKYKRLICPEMRCTKSFPTQFGLETHKKLHGNFRCKFCDQVIHYAPSLAFHEYEMHSAKKAHKPSKNKTMSNYKCKCARCHMAFESQDMYTKHFVNLHLGLSTTFGECSICKHASDSAGSLHSHFVSCHLIPNTDSSKIFRCNRCLAYFRKRIQLVRHKLKLHDRDDLDDVSPIKCEKCDKYFRTEAGVKIHVKKAHNKHSNNEISTSYNCVLDQCKQKFSHKRLLERHQKLHERGEFKCPFCDNVCDTAIKLITHETSKHSTNTAKPKVFSCSRCSTNNYSVGSIQNHFAEVHLKVFSPLTEEEKQMPGKFQCKFCELELSFGSDLAVHEAQHSQSTGYSISCPRCSQVVTKKMYVAHFLCKHLGTAKRKKCSICQQETTRLCMHYNNCHKIDKLVDNPQIYKCEGEDDNCKAYFIKANQLIRHKQRVHVNEWKCTECGKVLKNRVTLKLHMRLHPFSNESPKLPFPCDIASCNKRFNTTAELDCHKIWHNKYAASLNNTPLSEFKCEKCSKEFVFKTQLQSHMTNAHSERKFICPECGKVFKLKGGLDRHLLYHTDPSLWKFQCSTCGKKCVTKHSLASHMNVHSKEKSWVCQFCGNKYSHQHNWKNHLLAKHGDEDGVSNKIEVAKGSRLSRKGTKKGDCILAQM